MIVQVIFWKLNREVKDTESNCLYGETGRRLIAPK